MNKIFINNKINKVDGFTLAELLVVVAVVGILSSIAIASFSEYRDKARGAVSQAVIHSIKTALESYNLDPNADRDTHTTIEWHPNSSAASRDANADIILPMININKGYLIRAGVNSSECYHNHEHQFYIFVNPYYGNKRYYFQKDCEGGQQDSTFAKSPAGFW